MNYPPEFREAIEECDIDTFESMLETNPRLATTVFEGEYNRTALLSVIALNTGGCALKMSQTLIRLGANPNIPSEGGQLPLGAALHSSNDNEGFELTKLLLSAGADPNGDRDAIERPIQGGLHNGLTGKLLLVVASGGRPDRGRSFYSALDGARRYLEAYPGVRRTEIEEARRNGNTPPPDRLEAKRDLVTLLTSLEAGDDRIILELTERKVARGELKPAHASDIASAYAHQRRRHALASIRPHVNSKDAAGGASRRGGRRSRRHTRRARRSKYRK